ncbi:protein-L-isoaspartate(D-aspartate) O-methyltransferase [uncultured Chitinophaga sp.]|jgi:protein-L-isoaspartate(D-aspartate) O-methyltransferase|uniref:protein-L-isoaspartate(D-aspartate) O-methyltransferase n=1 Tax=uncultured Chitinophaga sp. TaxID=339340 RepID=UPI0026098E94|nr:protein-L-isoaspartate(D-aspartate) O-methyltransferase [uncultured Chitinophaga sp.]
MFKRSTVQTPHIRTFVLMQLATAILTLALSAAPFQEDAYRESRNAMVTQQIRKEGIRSPAVLAAMRAVPRHLFVPESMRSYAYSDRPVPIGYGQTISQPYIVAYMTQAITPQPGFKVLEIGTGSGYQAAILSGIVKAVYTIEIVAPLGQSANERLKQLGYNNVTVRIGDGYHGWKEQAPFDAIVVTAATAYIPPPLLEQLKENGKMILPVGSPFETQWLMLVTKKDGKAITKRLLPVSFVPFTRK